MPSTKKLLTAAAGSAGDDNLFVEDVFSTYLYTGNSSTRSIDNNIDLSGEGGLVWIKDRSSAEEHVLEDTVRGATKGLRSNSTNGEHTDTSSLTSFDNDGFSLGTGYSYFSTNYSGRDYVSWSFRKAEGWFDIVTFDGSNGSGYHNFNHNLNSTPKCIIVKRTDGSENWFVYHASLASDGSKHLQLNTSSAADTGGGIFGTPTSTTFNVQPYAMNMTSGSNTAVAYLFGDDAIFGEDGDEQICKMGTATLGGSGTGEVSINLGFEPQFVLLKTSAVSENWLLVDTMNGAPVFPSSQNYLSPNTTSANASYSFLNITSTGFNLANLGLNRTYIYMAIRRPMKVPEAGTEVFNIGTYGANRDNSSTSTYYAGFPVDMALKKVPVDANANNFVSTRMLGTTDQKTNSSAAERTGETEETFDSNTRWNSGAGTSSTSYSWMFKRAPKFMDVVCYNGTGSTHAVTHNLGIIPDLLICKPRTITNGWFVTSPSLGLASSTYPNATRLDSTVGLIGGGTNYFGQQSTSTNFYPLGTNNVSGYPYVAYLFGTVSGVSKVGTYTGTGNNVDVNCGFSAGARFVLIKRVNDGYSGNWYVWDTARGIVSGNDPYFFLNDSAAQVTNTDYIDPLASGFTVTSSAPADINTSGGTYLFLAIA